MKNETPTISREDLIKKPESEEVIRYLIERVVRQQDEPGDKKELKTQAPKNKLSY